MSDYWLGVLTLPAITAGGSLVWLAFHQGRPTWSNVGRSCRFCRRTWYAPWWSSRELKPREKHPQWVSISLGIHLSLHPRCKQKFLENVAKHWQWDPVSKTFIYRLPEKYRAEERDA